ncbi:MAG: ArsB/NhaD family transporter [Bacillota bacterium]|jgi:Na+/H+ antiporter NhaD/arsenite permease-like protein
MNWHEIISVVIFIVALFLIMTEKVNRTVASLSGACLILLLRIVPAHDAIEFIDFNTIGVLIGMMVIVAIFKNTGVFEYLAIFSAKKAKGNPLQIMFLFAIITAITSAFLDNVTTVLLMAPMTLVITEVLQIDPIPLLIAEIVASNIGGTATLIGDPPNIMIGSATELGFIDFLLNLGPIILVIFIVTMFILKVLYGKKLIVDAQHQAKIMTFDEKKSLKDRTLLKKCLLVLALVMLGFFFHEQFHYPSALVALSGAAILLLLSKENVDEIFHCVEWPTIFFFAGLFIMVGCLKAVGLINQMAVFLLNLTKGNILLTGIFIIWLAALASSFLDNIPFVATLIPLIKALGETGHTHIAPLWWAVSLGACLGGNGTLIGASANVVVAGIAEKYGYKLSFKQFIKIGFPLMIISIILATFYLTLFYLR